jgi:hypothetical protein
LRACWLPSGCWRRLARVARHTARGSARTIFEFGAPPTRATSTTGSTRPVQAGRVPRDAVEWLPHSLRCPRRIKPTRAAPSLRNVRERELRSPSRAVARPSGHGVRHATWQSRRHHHRQLWVTFRNTGPVELRSLRPRELERHVVIAGFVVALQLLKLLSDGPSISRTYPSSAASCFAWLRLIQPRSSYL